MALGLLVEFLGADLADFDEDDPVGTEPFGVLAFLFCDGRGGPGSAKPTRFAAVSLVHFERRKGCNKHVTYPLPRLHQLRCSRAPCACLSRVWKPPQP
jgi:hypothetical protein